MTSFEIGVIVCPWCLVTNKVSTNIVDECMPSVGDVTVCARCALPAVVLSLNERRKPTRTEYALMCITPEIKLAALIIAQNNIKKDPEWVDKMKAEFEITNGDLFDDLEP